MAIKRVSKPLTRGMIDGLAAPSDLMCAGFETPINFDRRWHADTIASAWKTVGDYVHRGVHHFQTLNPSIEVIRTGHHGPALSASRIKSIVVTKDFTPSLNAIPVEIKMIDGSSFKGDVRLSPAPARKLGSLVQQHQTRQRLDAE